jgi:G:T/U-mismatch repair DNA glycosylase
MGEPVETLADLLRPGVGFTDIIKRPTAGAGELRAEEYEHGREELLRKLHAAEPGTVIFAFKKTAEVLFGGFDGAGFLARTDDPWDWFVMPSPYAARERVDSVLDQLQEHRSVSSGQEGGVRVD